jgi:hypothetical protein
MSLMGQSATANSLNPKITEVYLDCDVNNPEITIVGMHFKLGYGPLKVTLGEFMDPLDIKSWTNSEIVVEGPADLCEMPGDYLLTVSRPWMLKKDSWDFTVGAVGPTGPQGPQGPEGPPGPAPGFRTVAVVITGETMKPGDVWIGEIPCYGMQEYAIGGGWDLDYEIPGVDVLRSMPGVVAPHVYHIALINETDQEVTLTGSVYAVCATY